MDLFRRAFAGGPIFACVSVPPQFGKTETALHALAWWLAQRPADVLCYATYAQDLADEKSGKAREYARAAGVVLREDTRSKKTWGTIAGGGMRARGITGQITGLDGIKLLFVDDPYRNRAEAESRVIRDKVDGEFRSTLMSRLHPDTSIILQHTRWHEDDQIGRIKTTMEREPGGTQWEVYNLPAVDEDGESLWPEERPADFLAEQRKRVGEYAWHSLYQGSPRPREGRLFDGVAYWDELPSGYRVSIGVDLAYTAKTSADYSVAVVLAESDGRCFVLDVVRGQMSSPDFAARLRGLVTLYPGAPMSIYASGTERGAVDFIAASGVPLTAKTPNGDKHTRAQPVSAAWNRGEIMLPRGLSWVDAFVGECLDFSGVNDAHDDQVDALAAAYDALAGAVPLVGRPTRGVNPTPYGGRGGRVTHRERRANHRG